MQKFLFVLSFGVLIFTFVGCRFAPRILAQAPSGNLSVSQEFQLIKSQFAVFYEMYFRESEISTEAGRQIWVLKANVQVLADRVDRQEIQISDGYTELARHKETYGTLKKVVDTVMYVRTQEVLVLQNLVQRVQSFQNSVGLAVAS